MSLNVWRYFEWVCLKVAINCKIWKTYMIFQNSPLKLNTWLSGRSCHLTVSPTPVWFLYKHLISIKEHQNDSRNDLWSIKAMKCSFNTDIESWREKWNHKKFYCILFFLYHVNILLEYTSVFYLKRAKMSKKRVIKKLWLMIIKNYLFFS